jgi:hypothetical protein
MKLTWLKEMNTRVKTTTPTSKTQELFQVAKTNVHFVTNQGIK